MKQQQLWTEQIALMVRAIDMARQRIDRAAIAVLNDPSLRAAKLEEISVELAYIAMTEAQIRELTRLLQAAYK